jgi:hypothetical protein
MGSTLVDRAIVDGLRSRIDTVETKAENARAQNLELQHQVESLQKYSDESLLHLVSRRLETVPTALVAIRGIDDGSVRATAAALRAAGARLPGVLWIEPSFALTEADAQDRLSQAVTDPYNKGGMLRKSALEALGRRLALGPGVPIPAVPPVPPAHDLLQGLAAAQFVGFDALGGPPVDLKSFPIAGSRVVVLDGNEGKVTPEQGAVPLIRAAAAAGALTTLGEVHRPSDTGPTRGTIVGVVRGDNELSAKVATVDDVDVTTGRAALALAIAELATGRAGHYGIGPGASRQVPDMPAPAAAGPRS